MFSAHCSTRNTFRSSNSCFFASSSGGQFLVSAASAAALAASRSFALTFSRERSHKKRHSSAALRRNRAPAGAQNKKSGIVPAHPAYIAPGTVTQEPSPAVSIFFPAVDKVFRRFIYRDQGLGTCSPIRQLKMRLIDKRCP